MMQGLSKLKRWSWVVLLMLPLAVSAQSVFYVSPTAQEGGDGSLLKPFNRIDKAVLNARDLKGEIVIYLRNGKYILDKPLLLTPLDGNDERSLSIKAYPSEKVVLTSNVSLALKWETYKKGIMKARLDKDRVMDMLLVNDRLRHMARFPNYDSTAIRFNGTSSLATSPAKVKKWKNPVGGYLHAMHKHDWGDFHYRIIGKDKKGNLSLEGGWQNNRPMGLHDENRMVENVFEELDAPGEWYYSRQEQTLYYYPYEGENVEELCFETPQLKHLVEIRGTIDNPVKNITIEGVELTGTVRTFMERYEPLLRSDWTVYRGAAVYLEGTENCKLHRCKLYNLGGNAVFFSGYNRGGEVTGSHLTEIGASAICFVGDVEAVRSPSMQYHDFVPFESMDKEKGPKTSSYPADCRVYDNLIHRIGLFEKQITGVELSMCQSITVSHNSIYDTPRAGINISEGTWGGHVIEFNDVFDTVKETGDHGSFNSWGRDRFWHPVRPTMDSIAEVAPELILADAVRTTVIRNNRFRCDRGWDIDLDDGSSNFHIYNNLCLNGGIKLREGFYRVVENNIMVNNSLHPHAWFNRSGDVFTRNIVMREYFPYQVEQWGRMVDYNIFADERSMAMVREQGTDAHSIVVPLMFANPSEGDYTLPDNSDAILKGSFLNFDMTNFGVVSAHLKAIARVPRMSVPVSMVESVDSQVKNWLGLSIKNLETLGERSATGMDSERGVYVVTADANGPLRDFIQANDVILQINEYPVADLEAMGAALEKVREEQRIKVVVFRGQKEQNVWMDGNLVEHWTLE